jgi:hypothetical protein
MRNMTTMELPILINASSTWSERSIEELDDHLIKLKVGELSSAEVAGAYRALCGKMLAQVICTLRKKQVATKEYLTNKKNTIRWMKAGSEGVISFHDMCETLNIDPECTKQAIENYVDNPEDSAISNTVVGVLHHVS